MDDILKIDGAIITNTTQVAQELNDYFCSVFTRENTDVIPDLPIMTGSAIMDIFFSQKDIKQKVLKLKPSSAPGPDMIPVRLLQDHIDELKIPLQKIFNLSMSTGIVPKDWNIANVTPIFKKGAKGRPSNYRPVRSHQLQGKSWSL